ncbi:MAG: alpha/beta hydrolase domain-containing protein [Proteobacteria bacterium]|nr:alpha/beta hydrolase domain-containing protein [Pseudomonadota bacterium]
MSALAPYAVMLPRVNADGNGIDGVVLPEVAVPVATYSGRNTRAAGFAQGELCHTLGSYMPFAKTEAERKANGDPRPSIAERYRDNADYQSRLLAVAQQLVQDRLMLVPDAEDYRASTLP